MAISTIGTNGLTTPLPASNLGTPSAINLSNGTALPVTGISATGTPSASTYLAGNGTWGSPSAARMQVFTSSGTFTVPTGITTVYVSLCGSGGGGQNQGSNYSGGGGAGGLKIPVSGLTPGASITVTVAAGAAGQYSGGAGGNAGNTSSFGAYLVAAGGTGGTTSPAPGGEGVNGTGIGDGGAGSSSFSGASCFAQGQRVYNTAGDPSPRGYGTGGCGGAGGKNGSPSNSGIVVVEW